LGVGLDGQMTATNLDHISGPVMRLDIVWFVSKCIRVTGVRRPEIYGRANKSPVLACALMCVRQKMIECVGYISLFKFVLSVLTKMEHLNKSGNYH